MGDKKEDSKNKKTTSFNYKDELSNLVEKNVLPSKVADKLIEKLEEKNVDLTKKQLDSLVKKVKNVIDDYQQKSNVFAQPRASPLSDEIDSNLEKLMNTVKKLEEKIGKIENGLLDSDKVISSNEVVTTDDISLDDDRYNTIGDSFLNMKPLSEVPGDPESVIILMKWLQFLVDKCGRSHLPEVLDYYVDIGWITEEAKISLLDYSNGITQENEKTEGVSELPSKQHIQSLLFIEKLKGHKFDKHFIDRIDGEISRLTKKFDNHKFK